MEASGASNSSADGKTVTPIAKEDAETVGSIVEHVDLITRQFSNPEVSDVVLKVGESSFQCNKFFLAMYSEVFKTMLMDGKWDDSQKCEITLEEDEDCVAVFGDFLKYTYSGRITLTTDTTLPILVLADKYDVQVLKKACEDYIKRHVKTGGNTRSAIKWLSKARNYNLDSLSNQCLEVIGLKLQEVFDKFHSDWLAFEFDAVSQILQNSNTGVNDELTVFRQIEKWLVSEIRVENLDENIAKLGPLIRFSQMTPLQLHEVETSDLVGRSGSHLTEYISEAYKFHLLNKQLGIFNAEKFSMRIYFNQIDSATLRTVKWKTLPSRERGQAKYNCVVASPSGAKMDSWGLEVFQQSPPKTGGNDDSFPKRNVNFLLYPNRAHVAKNYKARVVLIDGRPNNGDGYQAYRCEVFDGRLDGDVSTTSYPYLKSIITVAIDDVILRDELQFMVEIQIR